MYRLTNLGANRVRRDRLQPVIVQVEQDHLGLCGLENEVTKFLDFETGLERQLEFASLDDNIGEVK